MFLAELQLGLRDRDAAVAAVRGIDLDEAPPLLLVHAADLAARLDQKVLRDTMVDRALSRASKLEDRLAIAKVLVTLLREVPRGERIFAAALAEASDDEGRALVRWRECEAIREREDLPENSYYDALEKLAKDLPGTYYGAVARDRGIASQFRIGTAALPFAAKTTDGKSIELASLRGKAVLLVFWSPRQRDAQQLAQAVAALQQQHGDDLAVLGVGIDTDTAAFTAACKKLGAAFPQVCDGRGWDAELALRYHVETVPTLIAIDRGGAIAGLNLHVDTRSARDDLDAALRLALQRPQ
jgi:peroxiredoxin